MLSPCYERGAFLPLRRRRQIRSRAHPSCVGAAAPAPCGALSGLETLLWTAQSGVGAPDCAGSTAPFNVRDMLGFFFFLQFLAKKKKSALALLSSHQICVKASAPGSGDWPASESSKQRVPHASAEPRRASSATWGLCGLKCFGGD